MALQASALPVPRRAGLPLWEQIPLIFHQPFQPVRRAGRLCCMEEGWALLYGGRLGSVVWRKAGHCTTSLDRMFRVSAGPWDADLCFVFNTVQDCLVLQ